MKLSVAEIAGCMRVRGGSVLVVRRGHLVSTRNYDSSADRVLGSDRVLAPWATARPGDLAVEIVELDADRVIGCVYLSGDAINVVRYVHDGDFSDLFHVGCGKEFSFSSGPPPVIRLDRGTDVAVARLSLSIDALDRLLSVLRAGGVLDPMTDLLAKIDLGDRVATVHYQAPHRRQRYCCQPFVIDLLCSSPRILAGSTPFTLDSSVIN